MKSEKKTRVVKLNRCIMVNTQQCDIVFLPIKTLCYCNNVYILTEAGCTNFVEGNVTVSYLLHVFFKQKKIIRPIFLRSFSIFTGPIRGIFNLNHISTRQREFFLSRVAKDKTYILL